MSATIERETTPQKELADELHDLEIQEVALERRTRSLELAGPLSLIFSLFALALGMGAIVVALSNDSSGGAAAAPSSSSAPGGNAPGAMMNQGQASGGTTMMGAGGHGKFTSAQMSAATRGTVYTQLGDYWAAPTVGSVRAGKVTFVARNVGQVPHELMVERMPIKFDAALTPNEDAAQGMIPDMDPGQSGRLTMDLKPGKYMLFCNVEGHYAAGQHMVFTVKA